MDALQIGNILSSIFFSYWCGVFASKKKNRHPVRWFLLSLFLLTPYLGFAVLVFLWKDTASNESIINAYASKTRTLRVVAWVVAAITIVLFVLDYALTKLV